MDLHVFLNSKNKNKKSTQSIVSKRKISLGGNVHVQSHNNGLEKGNLYNGNGSSFNKYMMKNNKSDPNLSSNRKIMVL